MYRSSDFRSQQGLIIALTLFGIGACLMVYLGLDEFWRSMVFGVSAIMFVVICAVLLDRLPKLLYESRFGVGQHKVVIALLRGLTDSKDPATERFIFEHAVRVMRENSSIYAGTFEGVLDPVLWRLCVFINALREAEHTQYAPGPFPEHYREVADKLEQLVLLEKAVRQGRGDLSMCALDEESSTLAVPA